MRTPGPFKQILPKNLFGRVILIIILPIAIMQMAVAYFFFNAHWDTVTASLSDSVAADISVAVQLYKQKPGPDRTVILDEMLRPNMELSVALERAERLPTVQRRAFFSALDKTLRRSLTQSLSDPFWFDTTRYPNHIDIRVQVEEGVLRFIAARERVFAPTGFVFIFLLLTATVLLTLVSIMFIRNQARPIMDLAKAADQFGRGQDITEFKPSGASEVRLAGHSFLKMRQRIKRHIDQRTVFLAGVSHDLRTPLTRLKLHLALQDESDETEAAKADIKDMERMLDGYIDFAKGLSGETSERMNLADFLKTIIEKHTLKKPQLSSVENPIANIKPVALERAITNLISNAQKYGNHCRIIVMTEADRALIHIEDDGPGFSPAVRARLGEPYVSVRGEANKVGGGLGLGFFIAKTLIERTGGSVSFDNHPRSGGAFITLSWPVERLAI